MNLNLNYNDFKNSIDTYCNELNKILEEEPILEQKRTKAIEKVAVLISKLKANNLDFSVEIRDNLVSLKQEISESPKILGVLDKIHRIKEEFEISTFLTSLQSDTQPSSDKIDYISKEIIPKIGPHKILDEEGNQLIHLCAKSTHQALRDLVAACLKNGADPNSQNLNGDTPLHMACYFGDLDTSFNLIKNKAIYTIKNKNDFTPIDLAFQQKAPILLSKLINSDILPIHFTLSDQKPLWFAILEKAYDPSSMNSDFSLIADDIISKLVDKPTHRQDLLNDLLSLAIKNNLPNRAIELINIGTIFDQKPQRRDFLTEFVKEILSTQDLDSEKEFAIRNLIKQKVFIPGTPIFNQLMHHPDFKDFLSASYTPDEQQQIRQLSKLIDNMNDSTDLLIKMSTQKQVQDLIENFKHMNFRYLKDIQNDLVPIYEATSKRYAQAKEWIKKHSVPDLNPIKIQIIPGNNISLESTDKNEMEYSDVISICLAEQRYGLIPYALNELKMKFTDYTGVHKPLFHFLLDKTYNIENTSSLSERSTYSGGQTSSHALILIEALQQLQFQTFEEPGFSKEETEAIKNAIPNLIQSLSFCALWQLSDEEVSAERIVNAINYPEFRGPILIPYDRVKHATSISIEVSEDRRSARVILYDTGGAVALHPNLEGTNRYQTALSASEVPLVEFQSTELWKKVLSPKNNDSKESLHEIFDQLAAKGKLDPPSQNPFDYEQMQMQGTCSAQHLMAFVRYQLLKHIPGTTLEKLGIYKFLKARTLILIGKDRVNSTHTEIGKISQLKLEKHQADLHLLNVAKDYSDLSTTNWKDF